MCAQVAPSGEHLRGHGWVRLMWLLCAVCVGNARAKPSCSRLRANPCCPAWQLVVVVAVCQLGYLTKTIIIIRRRRSRSVAAYSRQTFPWTICRSVRRSVQCKNGDRIRMPFGVIGPTGPEIRQIVGFGDRSTGSDTFGGEFGSRHCNQRGIYGVRVLQHRYAALFPNYFGQTCY